MGDVNIQQVCLPGDVKRHIDGRTHRGEDLTCLLTAGLSILKNIDGPFNGNGVVMDI